MDPAVTPIITSHAGLRSSDFRHFVFDAYGATKRGNNGLSIIAGDKISNIFDPVLATYIEWERLVMSNSIIARLDQYSERPDLDREHSLAAKILAGTHSMPKSKQGILDYIDAHAG